jgi:hypothetical protein
MRLYFLGGVLAILLVLPETIFSQTICDTAMACDHDCCCSDGAAAPAGVMLSHVNAKKEWMLSYRFMNSTTDGLLSGSSAIDNNSVFVNYLMLPSRSQMNMHMFMVMYGVSSKLTLMTMFNYNSMAMEMAMFSANQEHNHSADPAKNNVMQTSGLGDIKAQALYNVLNSKKQQLIVSMGASIPVGSIALKGISNDVAYADRRLPYAMQTGSGTVDLLPGLSYLYYKNKWAAGSQIAGVVRTYNNSVGYHLGNEVSVQGWMAYKWLKFLSTSLRAEFCAANKISGKDASLYYYYEPSANPNNYGGQRASVYIGSAWQINNGFFKNNSLSIEYGIPFYQNVNGIQSKINSTLYASWAFTF